MSRTTAGIATLSLLIATAAATEAARAASEPPRQPAPAFAASATAASPATDPWEAIAPDRDRVLIRRSTPRHAADAAPARPTAAPGWLRTAGSLAAVVALIMLLAWGYRAVTGGSLSLGSRGRIAGLIDVVSRTALSPRQTLVLVRVGPRMVLLGVSPERIDTLETIADEALVARLAGAAARERPDSISAEFRQALHDQQQRFEAEAPPAHDGAADATRDDLTERLARALRRVRRSARQLGAA